MITATIQSHARGRSDAGRASLGELTSSSTSTPNMSLGLCIASSSLHAVVKKLAAFVSFDKFEEPLTSSMYAPNQASNTIFATLGNPFFSM